MEMEYLSIKSMIVYKTTNLVNGKIYIGQDSKNNPNYLGSGVIMRRAIKKYGKDKFIKEIIDYCKTKDELDLKEIYWINYYKTQDSNIGYNITHGGGGCVGLKHTDKTKKHMSDINKGKNNPMYGKKLSEKTLISRSIKVKTLGIYSGENNSNFKFKIDKNELFKLFIVDNMTIELVSKHYGCSKKVIVTNLRKYGINKEKSNKYGLSIKEINILLDKGLNQTEIGHYYGCSNKIINKFIKKRKNG